MPDIESRTAFDARVRHARLEAAVLVLAVGVLAVFYLRTLERPSLWLDEAWEANAYLGLDVPWYSRPVLFMATERLLARWLGPSELVLRLLPCLAGLAAVTGTYVLGRRELGVREGALGAALLALAPEFLFQAHQLKSYTLDALFTVALLLTYRRYHRTRSRGAAGAYVAVALISFGFTFTGVLVVATVFVIESVARGLSVRERRDFALLHVAIGACLLILYGAFHSGAPGMPDLQAYFEGHWLSLHHPLESVFWAAGLTASLCGELTGSASRLAASLIVVAGAAAAVRAGAWRLPATLAALLAVNLGASLVRLYPYGVPRTSLYLSPIVCLVLAAGMGTLVRRDRPWYALLAVGGLAYILFYPAIAGAAPYAWGDGWTKGDYRGAVAVIAAERRPGEAIFVYTDGAGPSFRYYWYRNGKGDPGAAVTVGERHTREPALHAAQVRPLAARYETVWCLFSNVSDEELLVLRNLFGETHWRQTMFEHANVRVERMSRRHMERTEAG